MALVVADRVQVNATANTTVSFTLSATAISGYQNFSVIGNGNTTYYSSVDGNGNWEIGLGTYATSGPTLTRTAIIASSNSGNAVTFSGTVTVFVSYPAEYAVFSNSVLAWQTVQTSSFTAVAGRAYPVNTTSNAVTVTLPASPVAGNLITVIDYAATASTNNITIAPNGSKINGSTNNLLISTARLSYNLVYIDATQGWISYAQQTSNFNYTASYLIVAGGGGGGYANAGGGGAGGVVSGTTTIVGGSTYTITVGGGGTAGTAGRGGSGNNSSITGATTAVGGGGGGYGSGSSSTSVGLAGGSGGGGASFPASSVGGAGTSGQGNAGGTSSAATNGSGGGGGGSSAVGSAGVSQAGGAGGAGTSSSISGTATTYAGGGGGGGGNTSGTSGAGGSGGGGAGGYGSTATWTGVAGTAYTGGGGGGGGGASGVGTGPGAAGGSGIVFLSVPTSSYSGSYTGTQLTSYPQVVGSNTVLAWTGSGSYTG